MSLFEWKGNSFKNQREKETIHLACFLFMRLPEFRHRTSLYLNYKLRIAGRYEGDYMGVIGVLCHHGVCAWNKTVGKVSVPYLGSNKVQEQKRQRMIFAPIE